MAGEGEVIACHSIEDWNKKLQEAKDSKKLIVIDFTASWCPPCRFIAPIFVDFAKKFPQAVFFKVDVDELQEVAKEYSVEAMPTFVFLKDGEIVDKVVGADKDALHVKITQHAAPAPVATA